MTWEDRLRAAYRRLEHHLDGWLAAAADGRLTAAAFAEGQEAAADLYAAERDFLEAVARHAPALAAKLAAQQAEVVELGDALAAALDAGDDRDIQYLLRRFCALAQHTIIEEERDVFPLAPGWFTPEETARLSHRLAAGPDPSPSGA